jgi:hypothetical protein
MAGTGWTGEHTQEEAVDSSAAASAESVELVSKILLRVKKGDPQGLKPAFSGGSWRHG